MTNSRTVASIGGSHGYGKVWFELVTACSQILCIYKLFRDEWCEQNFPNLIPEMHRIRVENPRQYPHELGHYAILYTPISYSPDHMIIGNNPSWFHSAATISESAAESARQVVIGLESKPPKKNLYKTGKFKFADEMQYVFSDHLTVLENAVGMNRFWIQTGGSYDEFRRAVSSNPDAKAEFDRIVRICEDFTVQIVHILRPKTIFLFGKHAQKLSDRVLPACEKVKHIVHPARQKYQAKMEINDHFSNCGLPESNMPRQSKPERKSNFRSKSANTHWNSLLAQMEPLFQELKNAVPLPKPTSRKNEKRVGIYAFRDPDDGKVIHVGQTRNLQQRMQGHRSKSIYSATLAFKLARKATGKVDRAYVTKGSRKDLHDNDSVFREEFRRQVEKIKGLDVLFVDVECHETRYLLEFYAVLKFGLPTDEFDTT